MWKLNLDTEVKITKLKGSKIYTIDKVFAETYSSLPLNDKAKLLSTNEVLNAVTETLNVDEVAQGPGVVYVTV